MSAAAALVAAVRHAREDRVDWSVVGWMAPPSAAAAILGGYFGHALPSRALLAVIAALLLWNGLDLVFAFWTDPEVRRPHLGAVVSGAVTGLLGGAVGLVLGTLRMPALVRSVGLSPHAAVGTNLAVGVFLGA